MEGSLHDRLQDAIEGRADQLEILWRELGFDEQGWTNRTNTVVKHVTDLLDKMVNEETKAKKNILDMLERHTKQAVKLSKELGVSFDEPDESLVLVKLEQAVRKEAERLEKLKEERLEEVRALRKVDEELCGRLGMDPFYISTSNVPNPAKLQELKDHIRNLEDQQRSRLTEVTQMRDNIIKLYDELDIEPRTDMEREIACESLDRFVLSTKNIELVASIATGLEDKLKSNQREVMESIERIDALYDRLQLDANTKFQFLSNNRGHSSTVIFALKEEIERLEELKRANIEGFIINIRNELHKLWDDCYYSNDQKNAFTPIHSTDFTEDLLEVHEAEAKKLKEHYELHKDLYFRVSKRAEIWSKFMELERKAKDPSRLMNARGNSLLMEEKERNKVNKQLPRVEQELHQLIKEWEEETGHTFLVEGVNFEEYIVRQKEEYMEQLELEKVAREQAKKRTIMQETRYGAKPSTPAKLKKSSINSTNSHKTNSIKKTPGSSRILSRLGAGVSSGLALMRSPRAARSSTPATTPVARENQTLRSKRRDSYGIKRGEKKNAKNAAKNKTKMARGVLSELDNSIVPSGNPANFTLQSVDLNKFKKGSMLNSTQKESGTPVTPSFMNPTAAAKNRQMFKTPTSSSTRSLSRFRTPGSTTSTRSIPRLH